MIYFHIWWKIRVPIVNLYILHKLVNGYTLHLKLKLFFIVNLSFGLKFKMNIFSSQFMASTHNPKCNNLFWIPIVILITVNINIVLRFDIALLKRKATATKWDISLQFSCVCSGLPRQSKVWVDIFRKLWKKCIHS